METKNLPIRYIRIYDVAKQQENKKAIVATMVLSSLADVNSPKSNVINLSEGQMDNLCGLLRLGKGRVAWDRLAILSYGENGVAMLSLTPCKKGDEYVTLDGEIKQYESDWTKVQVDCIVLNEDDQKLFKQHVMTETVNDWKRPKFNIRIDSAPVNEESPI